MRTFSFHTTKLVSFIKIHMPKIIYGEGEGGRVAFVFYYYHSCNAHRPNQRHCYVGIPNSMGANTIRSFICYKRNGIILLLFYIHNKPNLDCRNECGIFKCVPLKCAAVVTVCFFWDRLRIESHLGGDFLR